MRRSLAAAALVAASLAVAPAAHAEQSLSDFLADFIHRAPPPAAAPATTCGGFFTAAQLNAGMADAPILGRLLGMKVLEVIDTRQTGVSKRNGIKCEVDVFTNAGEMTLYAETKVINGKTYFEASPIDPSLFE